MDDRSPNFERRIDRLEAELVRAQELADRAADREARLGTHRNPRLAKTCAKSGESYPAAGEANTYFIKFLDSTFTEAEGNQTPTDTERQTNEAALAHFRGGDYLPEGTVVFVLWDNGRWWIIGAGPAMVKEDVLTDFRVDTANQKLQVKTRELFVQPSADETGWTDVHTGSVCP